ncbi:hypothetical protein [Acidicapsa ligni]|uniref:hypothetical protein n=1 Tax=Acidicapsa ligni TaxID=542300 RepID=UPI0021E03A37|nr:hypothetical protein [Acidicapsa ligni]
MSDMCTQLYRLIVDVVLPNLKEIEASLLRQQAQTEQLQESLDQLGLETRMRFAEMRADLTSCRIEVEDALVVLREREAVDPDETQTIAKKSLIH